MRGGWSEVPISCNDKRVWGEESFVKVMKGDEVPGGVVDVEGSEGRGEECKVRGEEVWVEGGGGRRRGGDLFPDTCGKTPTLRRGVEKIPGIRGREVEASCRVV